jgi:dipeptidyl aminopeptidase/acylaminoacyl peptidase
LDDPVGLKLGGMSKSPQPAPITVEDLWAFDRVGGIALSPDGGHAVVSVSTPSMENNSTATHLWLLPTDRSAPRRLTRCGGKDGQAAWSPTGERIAFVARREQDGEKDATPQIYVIARDGGEAQRVSEFAPGVDSFKWMPDGQRIVFAAWVWPELKGSAAQAKAHKAHTERKASGYATSEAFYRHWDHNVPMGRVLHLHVLDVASGKVRDLFEGSTLELPRDSEGNVGYDVAPDGRRVAFVHDRAACQQTGNRLALSAIEVASGKLHTLADDTDWDFGAPRYSPDGTQIAVTAAHIGRHHNALSQLALVEKAGQWRLLGKDWDYSVNAPLRWATDGGSLLFTAEERGRCHLWRYSTDGTGSLIAHEGGWVQGFDVACDVMAVVADSVRHPARVQALRSGHEAMRLEAFNDEKLAGIALGEVREVTVKGALNEDVQMWLVFPPNFDAKTKHPVMHVIHGGPYAAAGDTFSMRWNPHVFAAAGHVVAQVNYHGSSGFGLAFKRSLVGRQGELELQDIEAATDWLLKQRWADAKRFTATGGSYGGFLVAWMNGHVPAGRYQAYVCHAGVYDRIATFSADSYAVRPKDLAANYWEDMPRVLAQSPHASAANMQTPTLVIHGAQDFRVPDCNGLAYFNTLKARGVDARLLWFPDENHWVLKPQNSRQWYGEFLDWIRAYTDRPARTAKATAKAAAR